MRSKQRIYAKRPHARQSRAQPASMRPYRQAVRKARSEAGFTGLVSTR